MTRDLDDLVQAYMDQNSINCVEGRRGVESLCQLTRALGYQDPYYMGQLSPNAAIGDLIMFLEDNSGAITAIIEWISTRRSQEFFDALEAHVTPDPDEEAEDDA